MEENMVQAIEMAFATFAFIIALTSAVVSYNRLEDNADNLIEYNISSRQGATVYERANNDYFDREVEYSEIVMSALTMPRTSMTNGNYQVIIKTKDDRNFVITTNVDDLGNEKINFFGMDYFVNNTIETKIAGEIYQKEIKATDKNSLNQLVKDIQIYIPISSKYRMSYTETSITYQEI